MIAKLANLSFQTGRFPTHFKRAQVITAATEEGQSRQLIVSELQTDLQSVDGLQGTGETSADTPMATSAWLTKFQPLPVGV